MGDQLIILLISLYLPERSLLIRNIRQYEKYDFFKSHVIKMAKHY